MSGYSSIFSSGLLASPRPDSHAGYADFSTPSRPHSPINVDSDPDTTPTKLNAMPIPSSEEAMSYFMPRSRASSNASGTSSVPGVAPRLRRRRSSLSMANNGLSAVKSPQRNVGIALQRNSLMGSSARARSGSTDVGPAELPSPEEGGHGSVPNRVSGGRSRSGSTGGTMRPPRALRKPPPVPPPTSPLPPLPTSAPIPEVVHRRPLVHRAHTAENFAPFTAVLRPESFTLAPVDFTKVRAAMGTPPSSSPLAELSVFWSSGARTNEN